MRRIEVAFSLFANVRVNLSRQVESGRNGIPLATNQVGKLVMIVLEQSRGEPHGTVGSRMHEMLHPVRSA